MLKINLFSFIYIIYLQYLCKMKKKLRIILGLFLIVLYLGYYGETTLFVHTHYTPYGMITHSHPFKSAHHTIPAYITISILSYIVFFSTMVPFFETFLCKISTIKTYILLCLHPIHYSQHIFLRAPPIMIDL